MDIDQIVLPKRSCASYMRRDELKTISYAHKATVLCDDISKNKVFNINTDGTTKEQRKLGSIGINGMALPVAQYLTYLKNLNNFDLQQKL